MKLTKLILCFSTLALGIASAASSYKVSLPGKMWVGNTELKAGDYKVEVTGNQATFKSGKDSIQVPAALETSTSKYPATEIEASESKLTEIHVGGTTARIVFPSAASKPAAQ